MVYARIAGVSAVIPEGKRWTNQDLVTEYGFDEYGLDAQRIAGLTGIQERVYRGPGVSIVDMLKKASYQALDDAGVEIDTIIVASDNALPERQGLVGELYETLREGGRVFGDVRLIEGLTYCSGFVEGLDRGGKLITDEGSRGVLVVGFSGASDYIHGEKETCGVDILWGDAAGGMVLTPATKPGILDYHYKTIPEGKGVFSVERLEDGRPYLGMDGMRLVRLVRKYIPQFIREILEQNNYRVKDVAQFVLHQANARMLEIVRKVLKASEENFLVDIKKKGNTIAASIPLAYRAALDRGKIAQDKLVVFSGFGAYVDEESGEEGMDANVMLYQT